MVVGFLFAFYFVKKFWGFYMFVSVVVQCDDSKPYSPAQLSFMLKYRISHITKQRVACCADSCLHIFDFETRCVLHSSPPVIDMSKNFDIAFVDEHRIVVAHDSKLELYDTLLNRVTRAIQLKKPYAYLKCYEHFVTYAGITYRCMEY